MADTGNHRIQKLTSGGIFLAEWGSEGNGQGQFRLPRGLIFDSNRGFVYVADTGNHREEQSTSIGPVFPIWLKQVMR